MIAALTNTYFFELLQVAVGNRDMLSGVPSAEEWEEIYETAKKQTLAGIAFKGVERLPQEQLPPRTRIRQWFMKADKIRKRNLKMNVECAKTCYVLAKRGFHSCIIKGQANIRNYGPSGPTGPSKSPLKGDLDRSTELGNKPPFKGGLEGLSLKGDLDRSTELGNKPPFKGGLEGLGLYRTPGDIDVWVWGESGKVSEVINSIASTQPSINPHYHHVDCRLWDGCETETEVHYRPSWMSAPWRNIIFQRFCEEHKNDVERYPIELPDGRKTFFFVPSTEFDAVYQLVHIYRHLFAEGIGLRQMMDYWTLLTSLKGRKEAQIETMQVLKKLGMKRFAAAVMWVLAEVFDPHGREWMLCEPDEKEGRFLLTEIMLAGNFGHEDERYTITREENAAKWGLMKMMRNMKFLTSYPEEVICEPLFRVFHWAWRTFKLWRF